jgi:hypothetical protein
MSFSFFFLCSCQQDIFNNNLDSEPQDEEDILYPLVDEDLWSYFVEFEKEASLRNIDIDLEQLRLTGNISKIHEDNVAGVCHYSSNSPNVITIDQSFWNQSSEYSKEMVVFHELGHCVLGKGHREDADGNGSCLSIMRSGLGNCITRYNQQNRAYYLDELFLYEE